MEVLNTDPRQLSPLNLAFIGDCVYEMQVRCHLVALANRPAPGERKVRQCQGPNGGLCPHGAVADRGRTGGV